MEAARRRLAGRNRPVPRRRLQRMVRQAGLAVALGGLAAGAMADLAPAAKAGAIVLPALPPIKLPARQPGYQLATTKGAVVAFGAAAKGEAPDAHLAQPVVAVARTRTGAGAWTATADGGVLTSGDAKFYGSLGGTHLNDEVVGIAATTTGAGYWLVSADGGVFAFGDAAYHGSLAGHRLNAPVVELVPTPSGAGYWLASADGGIFTFGDATYRGSVTSPLQGRVTAMAATPSGRGYWLAGSDGGVFAYGDATFLGRPGRLQGAIVGIAGSRTGDGYWLVSSDGGVFSYGDAPFLGSTGGNKAGTVVGITAGPSRVKPELAPAAAPAPVQVQAAEAAPPVVAAPTTAALAHPYGNDVSWPQCDGPMPAGKGFGIVGVTGGRPFTRNRCLADQWRWATTGGSAGGVYVNLASPVFGDPAGLHGPAGDCAPADLPCQTYNHSANNVEDALAYAQASGVDAPLVWLDVEVLNRWSTNDALNALTVKAAAETLGRHGIRAGVYSTPYQWRLITGGARNGLPAWVAGSPDDATSQTWCANPAKDFTGGGVWLVQSLPVAFDVNFACAPAVQNAGTTFRF